MKHILLIFFLIFGFHSSLNAYTVLLDEDKIQYRDIKVFEICTGGYKFVVVREHSSKTGLGQSITQVLNSDGKPIKCK